MVCPELADIPDHHGLCTLETAHLMNFENTLLSQTPLSQIAFGEVGGIKACSLLYLSRLLVAPPQTHFF